MRILSLDPGSKNFGYAVSVLTDSKYEILEVGQILNTITNLTHTPTYRKPTKAMRAKAKKKGKRVILKDMPFEPPLDVCVRRFVKVVDALFRDHDPDCIVVERFQARGMKGQTIECVSIMIGILIYKCHRNKTPVRLLTAATWKNRLSKFEDITKLYSYAASLGFTPHEVDACCMAIYIFTLETDEISTFLKRLRLNLKGL